jgi:hypothetical protein
MIEINDGGRAFPWCGDLNDMPTINLGMTLRDYFAAKAIQGLLSNNWPIGVETAERAYLIADLMISARARALGKE